MAEIADVTVAFELSPRIATIPLPITDVTVQDLVDTLRDIEDEPSSMSYAKLLDATGKVAIGDDFVGITMVLNNLKIAFAARGGPSFIQCRIDGGNTAAIDSVGDPLDPIEPTAFTQVVIAQSSSATITPTNALTKGQFLALQNP